MSSLPPTQSQEMSWLGLQPKPIPDHLRSALSPASSCVQEWTEYWLKIPNADAVRIGTNKIEPIDNSLFQIQFENTLGLSTIQPYRQNVPLGSPIHVEVLSSKFPFPDKQYEFYRGLLDDLFARAARLPFHFIGPTNRRVTESLRPPTPLFVYYFLLQFGTLLRQAADTICARPHRLLVDHPAYVPLAQAHEADMDVMLDILHSPERWERANGFPLAQIMGGYAPTQVWQRLPEETLDTPENRFVLAFLRQLLVAAETLPRQVWWKNVPAERQRYLLLTMGLLRETLSRRLFDEVGEMQRAPYASQVLLRREGYREMRELHDRFQQARRPLFAVLQHAIEVRDIATLYEQWCFFALAEEIGLALERTPVVKLETTDESGLKWRAAARFGSDYQLLYNEDWKGYSMRLRPDFSWLCNGNPDVVLDAKFRMEWTGHDPDEECTSPEAKTKREDLYKMHTYRDALAHCGVRAAVAVYPGDLTIYHSAIGDGMNVSLTLAELLTGDFTGIGAVNLAPANQDRETRRSNGI